MDKDGKVPTGTRYQNSKCAAYKLMANNDGSTFAWTAGIQIVIKVYLKKHLLQPRTSTLNRKDKQMVQRGVNNMA